MIRRTLHYGWTLPEPQAVGYWTAVNSLLLHLDASVASLSGSGAGRFTVVISCFASASGTFGQFSYRTGSLAPYGAWQGSVRITRPGLVAFHANVAFMSIGSHDGNRELNWNAILTRLDGTANSAFLLREPSEQWRITYPDADIDDPVSEPAALTHTLSLAPGPYGVALQMRVIPAGTPPGSATCLFVPGAGVQLCVEEL